MNWKNVLLSLVILLAIGLSWLLVRNSFKHSFVAGPNQPTTPDGFMIGVHYTRFNQLGTIAARLDANKIVHYQEEDTAQLDHPRLTIHNNDNQTWVITADQGISTNGSRQVDLRDHVIVKRIIQPGNKVATLTTTAMTAYPNKQFAQTNQPVKIVQPGSVINAVGMTANLNTGDINLLSHIHGVYQKNGQSGQP